MATGTVSGTLHTPPQVQGDIITLRAAGKSKRQIAKQLGVHRSAVDNVLARYGQDKPKHTRIQSLVPLAYDAVEYGLRAKDAKLGLDLLKCTDLAESKSNHYTINADQVLMSGLDLMPKPVAAQPVLDCTPSTTPSTGTEAPANPSPSNISLSSHTNFSQILASASTEELEAELARRRATPDALGIKG